MSNDRTKHAVGIDLGGTSIKLALVGEQGNILARTRIMNRKLENRAAWFDAVESGREQLRATSKSDRFGSGFCGIGVGAPGFVEFEPLRKHPQDRMKPVFYDRVQVLPAQLGSDAGVIGSAMPAQLA